MKQKLFNKFAELFGNSDGVNFYFSPGRVNLIGEHTDYVAAMKQTAENLNVPLIDLYSMSRAEMRKAGAEKTKEWYMHLPAGVYPSHMDGLTDNTHLKYMGAVVYAGCIARGLKELGGIYSDLLVAWE